MSRSKKSRIILILHSKFNILFFILCNFHSRKRIDIHKCMSVRSSSVSQSGSKTPQELKFFIFIILPLLSTILIIASFIPKTSLIHYAFMIHLSFFSRLLSFSACFLAYLFFSFKFL